MNDTILTAAYVLWGLLTLAAYLAHRLDGQARAQAWRHIADERRKLWLARRVLDDERLRREFPERADQLDGYLRDERGAHAPGPDR